MAKIIQTSFKDTEEKLYLEVRRHSDKSAFIKECIVFYLDSVKSNRIVEDEFEDNNVGDMLKNIGI